MTTLSDIKTSFRTMLYLTDDTVLDVILGAVVASQLPGDAICLYIVGPPSSGKTEIIRAFQDYPKSHHLSSLTPNTFMSGFSNKRVGETSLLLKFKTAGINLLFLKDFTSVLSMRPEVRGEIVSQVREIIDGYYSKSTGGEKGVISWQGKLSFIAGVTKAIEKESEVTTTMGERFLFVRMPHCDPFDSLRKAQEVAGHEDSIRAHIADITVKFITSLPTSCSIAYDPDVLSRISSACSLLSICRSHVSRSYGIVDYIPEPEGPYRIMKQLTQIGKGIAIARNKSTIDPSICTLLSRLVTDSMPSLRWSILSHLWKEAGPSGKLSTKQISNLLGGIPSQTTYRYLEDMELSGILQSFQDVKATFWSIDPVIVYHIRRSNL